MLFSASSTQNVLLVASSSGRYVFHDLSVIFQTTVTHQNALMTFFVNVRPQLVNFPKVCANCWSVNSKSRQALRMHGFLQSISTEVKNETSEASIETELSEVMAVSPPLTPDYIRSFEEKKNRERFFRSELLFLATLAEISSILKKRAFRTREEQSDSTQINC